jgi:thiol-disulfide isomerase/thioredoxin
MKNYYFPFLAIILLVLNSFKNESQYTRTNSQGLSICYKQENDSKELRSLFIEFLNKQNHIKIIKYNVNIIDTFVDGTIWNHTGTATLERNDRDTVFKFSFYGKRDDVPIENFYFENNHFQVFQETKTYRIEVNYGINVLGAPGGQMVVVDLLNIDTTSSNLSIQNKDDKFFVVKIVKERNDNINTKILTINKLTLLPVEISNTVINKELNVKQSMIYLISNVLINEQIENNELSNMAFLSNYTQEIETVDKSADILVGKKVPEILLVTFENDTVHINCLESKVVLLDFWELWCGACLKSLPKIQEITKKYSSKGLITIGIVSSNIENAKTYLEKRGLSFMQTQGSDEIKTIFKVTTVPRYVLIDKKGIIESIYYGFSDKIDDDIQNLIAD